MSDLIEDEEFIKKYGDAYGRVNYYEMAHVLSGRLRQMEKRSKAANKRADQMQVALEAKDKLISELVEALIEIRELNMENEDENGHRWANSDMINQSVVLALSKAKEQE